MLPFSLETLSARMALPEDVKPDTFDSPALVIGDELKLLGTITDVTIGAIVILVAMLGTIDDFENSIFN